MNKTVRSLIRKDNDMKIKGIDISKHQGLIDFMQVVESGIEFAIVRTGYSRGHQDIRFLEYASKIQQTPGLLLPAVYHFSYALSVEHAVEEAKFAVSLVEKAKLNKDTIIFYDYEYDSVKWAKENGLHITKELCFAFTEAFCDEVTRLGYKPGVYFNMSYYNDYYTPEVLGKYILWLAQWNNEEPRTECTFKQYSSKGKISGINSNVDLNIWYSNTTKKSLSLIVHQVMLGKYGNGEDRKAMLKQEGYDVNKVQYEVNKLALVVSHVLNGRYGNGDVRINALRKNGFNPEVIQDYVNAHYED